MTPPARLKSLLAEPDFTFECIHTPGHIANHLCYGFKQEKALFTGDHVMGWSTSMVAPPEGDMADYFASLEKLMGKEKSEKYIHDLAAMKP